MKTLHPIATWEGLPWIGPCCAVNDFNGDGRNELLFIQSAGAHANSFFDPRVNNGYGYKTGVEDQELFCMTLADPEGNILWQTGEPWQLERPYSWNGHCSDFCDLVDVDGDGRRNPPKWSQNLKTLMICTEKACFFWVLCNLRVCLRIWLGRWDPGAI